MFVQLVKELDAYLNCKGGLNAQEEELRKLCDMCIGTFPIACLRREDLEKQDFNVDGLTDSQMERLAEKLGDAYVENDFIDSLNTFAMLNNIPLKNE